MTEPTPPPAADDASPLPAEPAARADARFLERLSETGARDPREFYRGLLRELRQEDPTAYTTLVARYDADVVGAIASGEADPLEAWLAFGAALAVAVTGPGRLVAIGAGGEATEAASPLQWDQLLLYLPEDGRRSRRGGDADATGGGSGGRRGVALPVGLPPELSPAQRATVDLLVGGKVRPPE